MRLKSDHSTEARLLEAAGTVFAERGYRAATVREIIQRAGANVAAVNYHFGDKAGLYAATFRHARTMRHEKYPVASEKASAKPEEKLFAFVRGMLHRVLECDKPAWTWQLIMREMAEPSGLGVLDEMVRESIAPDFQFISRLLGEITGLRANDPKLRLCVASVVGQVLFYRHAQPVWQRLHPEQRYGDAEIEKIARHVTEFSLAAMTDVKKRRK
jgi:AcrR family transcriptional regulator